jgi:hypothetical protein
MARNWKSIVFALAATTSAASCRSIEPDGGRAKWGIHSLARGANILNLLPGQSVEVCAGDQETIAASHDAIKQWSEAIGRWGHFKINDCGSGSNLRINMSLFNEIGFNYFTINPGQIYIASFARGNYRKAIILHEYGHSFGLCDQYMDAGQANCSDDRAPRQNNNEVMGSTHEGKLRLTPGDIAGVRQAAASPVVRSTRVWQQYLTNLSQNPPTPAADFFALVMDTGTPGNPKVAVSVPAGTALTVCPVVAGGATCAPSSSRAMEFVKSHSVNNRDIYTSKNPVGSLLGSGQAQFEIAMSGSVNTTAKFQITKR